jgi:acyl-CoA thioesterase
VPGALTPVSGNVPAMSELDELLSVLRVEPDDDGRCRAGSIDLAGGPVVFGGQLLAQSIVAGASVDPAKDVVSAHIVFAKGARADEELRVRVEPMSTGRSFSSATVTVSQRDERSGGDRLCTRAVVLLAAPLEDLVRHHDPMPTVAAPKPGRSAHRAAFWETDVVGDVDVSDPALVGPPELDVWTRFAGAPDDPLLSCALLGFASDGYLIGAAMRPHAGIGQSMAHRELSTSVIAHTISFHEPFRASEWLLLHQRSSWAGAGRSVGEGLVYTEDGRLVAGFTQENMIRSMPAPTAGEPAGAKRQ